MLRFLSSSMILHSSVRPMNGCRSRTLRRSTSDAGKKPRRPMSMISPPLTTSMTGPLTAPSAAFLAFVSPQSAFVLRPLLRQDQPAVLVLLLENEGFESARRARRPRTSATSLRIESSFEGMTPSDL